MGCDDFGLAAEGEWAAGFAPVADIAVGHGDEEHVVAGGGPARGGAPELEFAVIGMGAEGDDAEFAVVGGRHRDAGNGGAESGGEREKQGEERDDRGGTGAEGGVFHREGTRKGGGEHGRKRGGRQGIWWCRAAYSRLIWPRRFARPARHAHCGRVAAPPATARHRVLYIMYEDTERVFLRRHRPMRIEPATAERVCSTLKVLSSGNRWGGFVRGG